MGASQRSFETRYGRFNSGYEYLKTQTDYLPTSLLINIEGLQDFITDVASKNEAVTTKELIYREHVRTRKINGFRGKGNLENCLENRIRNSMAYVGAEFKRTSTAYKMIKALVKKIKPVYKKKDPGAPKGEGKSPSEQSFVALIGYGKETANITGELGAGYNPSDPDIQTANILAFCNTMETYTKNVTNSEMEYAEAVKARKELYDGADGMQDRIKIIKDYLASFPGGKKGEKYVEYLRLINGN